MKSGLLLKWVMGLGFCGLTLTGGCLEGPSVPPPVQTVTAAEAEPELKVQPAVYESTAPSPAATTTAADVVTAPAQAVTAEKTVPSNLRLSAPAKELVKLANSGVEEGVMLSYVTNSTSTFNLGADEIIYLNDIGVPGAVVSAMIQQDQALKLTAANVAVPAVQPAPTGPPPGPPAPAEVAPQPEPTAAVYPPLTPPAAEVTYGDFYSGLAPYGTWVDVEGYGRCWQPTVVVVNPWWQPYFDCGSWAYTDCGWYWRSDYSWGWAPFHYGRWFRHGHFGWCWAPDTVWGPSWVSWRHSDAYCGWAPLPPGCFFTAGIGFTFHGRRMHDYDDFGQGRRDYRFVAWRDFQDRRLHGRELPDRDVTQVFNRTVVVNRMVINNNTVINQGIAPERVANATQRDVRQVALMDRTGGRQMAARDARTEVRQRTLTVYRPDKPLREQNAGVVADRSGVPIRQGLSQSAPTARGSIEARTIAPRTPSRLAEPKDEVATAERLGGGPVISRTPGATVAPQALAPSPAPSTATSPARPTPSVARTWPNQLQTTPSTRAQSLLQAPSTTVGRQPVPATRTITPAQNPNSGQAWTQPPLSARPNVSQATPWLENRAATPAPAQRQYTPPAYAPQRSYTPPAAPSVPRWTPPASQPAPSRPAVADVPRYSPPPAPSRPAMSEAPRYSPPPAPPQHSSGAQTRSAPSAPSSDRGSSSGNSQRR